MQANLPICLTCHYRLPASHACALGAVDKPTLCPRQRKQLRILSAPPHL
jgi:hypothetical protein